MDSTTVQEDGFTVTSTSETADQIREAIAEPAKAAESVDPISQAASELGKRGAEARKAKRDAEAAPDTARSAGDAQSAEGESDQGTVKPLGKPRDDPRARMLEATRKEAEAKRERAEAKADAEAARKELAELKARLEPPTPAKAAEGKPAQQDYATYDEWVEAVADWKADAKLNAWQAKQVETAKVKQYADYIDGELGKATAARNEAAKADPEFFSKLSDDVKAIINHPSFARDLDEKIEPYHIVSDELITAGQAGPRVMLHLSANPDELQRILALQTPQEIQIEMRLLARSLNGAITQATAPNRVEVSRARPPIRPVTGTSHVSDAAPGEDASYADHRRYWAAKDRVARR